MAPQGVAAQFRGQREAAAFLAAEGERWVRVIRDGNMTTESGGSLNGFSWRALVLTDTRPRFVFDEGIQACDGAWRVGLSPRIRGAHFAKKNLWQTA